VTVFASPAAGDRASASWNPEAGGGAAALPAVLRMRWAQAYPGPTTKTAEWVPAHSPGQNDNQI
jgi:hypothetical protein